MTGMICATFSDEMLFFDKKSLYTLHLHISEILTSTFSHVQHTHQDKNSQTQQGIIMIYKKWGKTYYP